MCGICSTGYVTVQNDEKKDAILGKDYGDLIYMERGPSLKSFQAHEIQPGESQIVRSSSPDSGSRDSVLTLVLRTASKMGKHVLIGGRRGRVNIDVNRRVACAVASRELHRRTRASTPSTRNRQLRALRIELRLVARMDRQRLVPNHILSTRQAPRDRARPARVLRNHLSARPLAVRNGAADQAAFIDLEPVERGGVGGGARAAAGGHVDHHGTDGVRPRVVPEGGNLGPSADSSRELRGDGRTGGVAGETGIRDARDRAVRSSVLGFGT